MMLANTQFYSNGRSVTCVNTCVDCKKRSEVVVGRDQFDTWQRGAFVQVAFPDLTSAERELFFMTGQCGECWDKMFAPEGDDLR